MAMLFVCGLVAAVNVAIRHGGLAVAGHFAVVAGVIVFESQTSAPLEQSATSIGWT